MYKKILCVFICLFLFGCSSEKIVTVKKANGESKTYAFFKDFNPLKYYVSFFDRNSTDKDDTKIIMAREDDKYYYEIKGAANQVIIQEDGFKYTISNDGYFKEESSLVDYSLGILPRDISSLKTMGYKMGKRSLYGRKYVFEEYKSDDGTTSYYFDGDKLIFISYKTPLQEIFLKFDKFGDLSSDIFEINSDLHEITY